MRVGTWRWLTFAAVVLPCFALLAGAAPPTVPTKNDEGESTSEQRAKLQAELLSLLKRISVSPSPMQPPTGPPTPKGKYEPSDGAKVDAIKEGMNLFRDNNFEAARRTFQLIDPAALGKEDRVFVRYMLASSLRRLGKSTEAEGIYREVANSPDDEFLANCAIWQLSMIRSEQDLQLQLEQLRSRAKSK